MNKLIDALEQIIQINNTDWKKIFSASINFIEVLSISTAEEIEEMLDYVYKHRYLECPFWARLIAFRLLILLKPNDERIKQWAINDVSAFTDPILEKEIKKRWLDSE